MPRLRDRLIDPSSPDRRPRRAAYALPTLFTAGNIYLGYISVIRSFRGAMQAAAGISGAEQHFQVAAITIGVAAFLDGLDGRIARMTNTTSDFGREMDSLADVISFGIAPAVLAFAWGVQFAAAGLADKVRDQIHTAGYFFAFLFLLCGAARLARFNIQANPKLKNPGRPDRKYFAGLPIPAAAAAVAAVVYAFDSVPLVWWPLTVVWMAFLCLLSFLMVSTWRYYSFKDISLLRPRSRLLIVAAGILIYLVWNYSQPVLLAMALTYVASGIVIRVGGILRRHLKHGAHPHPEHEIG